MNTTLLIGTVIITIAMVAMWAIAWRQTDRDSSDGQHGPPLTRNGTRLR